MRRSLMNAISAGNKFSIKIMIALGLFLTASTGKTQTGQALDFDGTNSNRVILPFVINNSYTKELWIKPAAASLTGFPNIFSGNTTALYLNNGKLTAGHAGSGFFNH